MVSVERAEATIRTGMSLDEVALSLGQVPGAFDGSIKSFGAGDSIAHYGVTLAEPGFQSDHYIWLYLDKNKRVTTGIAKVFRRFDEKSQRLKLRP